MRLAFVAAEDLVGGEVGVVDEAHGGGVVEEKEGSEPGGGR